ncbi:MAG: chorismate mutase [Candidatus Bathyarchaeia archaeon]|nr:chorismate mutase [Candidatus Bathyarchaeota archaeon]
MNAGSHEDLKAIRNEMARLTLEIIRLSGERLALARKIGEIKAQINAPIEDPLVENELKIKVVNFSKEHGIDVNFSLKLLDLLLSESKRIQQGIVKSKLKIS